MCNVIVAGMSKWATQTQFLGNYRTLAKKRPWAVHLILGSNWGVGGHSRNHRYILTRKSAQVYTCT